MGVHDGHRQRMKSRFARYGLESFDDVNALELLLFYAIPRCDTNIVAHSLLDRFGSLEGVFDAAAEELETVPGVGKKAAELLGLVPKITRRYMLSRGAATEDAAGLTSEKAAGNYAVSLFIGERRELAYLLCLDSLRRIICRKELPLRDMTVDEAVRFAVETALKHNAANVMIMHFNPDGAYLADNEDLDAARRIMSALDMVRIPLADYIVVSGTRYSSLAGKNILMRLPGL